MAGALRVVMVTTSYPRREGDFAGHFVASLASSLVELGHAVTVVAPHDPGTAYAEERAGVSVRRVRYAPDALEHLAYGEGIVPNIRHNPLVALAAPGLAGALRRGVREHAADASVVHAHWAPTSALAGAGRAGAPLVVTLHGSDLALATRGGVWRALLRTGLAGAGAVNVMAQSQRDILRASGLYDGPVEVIPSGIAPALCARGRPMRTAGFKVLFVGRLVPGKGVDDLLVAFVTVADALPDARLAIAGSGRGAGDLAAKAVALGISERVDFLGEIPHDRALELMASVDVLALPSYGEGSPLSVTEALALGTPVVGTTVGAMPELVAGEGILVEPGDIGGIATALIALAGDRGRLDAMGASARERMLREYAWPAIAARTVELYRDAGARTGAVS